MKNHIKLYEEYTAQNGMLTDRDEIHDWLLKHHVKHYVINEDLTVSTEGHVNFQFDKFRDLKRLPVKFDFVDGNFTTGENFETLFGCPNKVGGNFKAMGTFKTLEGSPSYIKGSFDCDSVATHTYDGLKSKGELIDLRGGPEYVGEWYTLRHQTKLKTLEGFPKNFNNENDKLSLYQTISLRTLVYAPFKTKDNLAIVMTDLGSYNAAPCYDFYSEYGWSTKAHATSLESWANDEPEEVKGFIERLAGNDKKLYLDIMANSPQLKELVGDNTELTNAYKTSVDVEGDFY